MSPETRDVRIASIRPIFTPAALLSMLPLGEDDSNIVSETRHEIESMLHTESLEKLLVVVGPCSIHDPIAALEYA